MSFERYFPPDPEAVLAMRPEEVAALLLQVLRERRAGPIEPNFAITLPETKYAGPQRLKVLLLMAEALAYLQREGLIVPFPPELHNYVDKSRVYFMLSRAGATIELPAGLEQHQHAQLLPKELLHSSLTSTVLPLFQRRDYETAVFGAMKQVEVAVRAVLCCTPRVKTLERQEIPWLTVQAATARRSPRLSARRSAGVFHWSAW